MLIFRCRAVVENFFFALMRFSEPPRPLAKRNMNIHGRRRRHLIQPRNGKIATQVKAISGVRK